MICERWITPQHRESSENARLSPSIRYWSGPRWRGPKSPVVLLHWPVGDVVYDSLRNRHPGVAGGGERARRRLLLADVDLAVGRPDPLVGQADQALDVVLARGVVGLEDVGAAPVGVEDDDVAATRVDEVVEEARGQDAVADVQRLLHRLARHAVGLHDPQLDRVRDRHGHRNCEYEVDDRVLADCRERAPRALGRARRRCLVAHRTSD